jgi:hypothetical protein
MTFTPAGFTHSFGRDFYIQDALELLPPLPRFLVQGRGGEYGQHNSSDHHHHRNIARWRRRLVRPRKMVLENVDSR